MILFLLLLIQAGAAITPHPAKYWEKLEGNLVRCQLCPNNCPLAPGKRGICRVRENKKGELVTLVYGIPCAIHIDPIEKKPLFHFLPKTKALSLATAGCNMRCKFCQNWDISQRRPEETENYSLSPVEIVELAKEQDCKSIAYTYSEPTIFYEYMLDIAKLARKAGIKNIIVSNGYINPEPLKELCKYMDAANIDLKGFTDEFYRELTMGRLEPVKKALKIYKEQGVELEITNLIIPTKNDNMETIKKMCIWIRDSLGPDIPLHFSRFWPKYKLTNLPPTSIETLEKARKIALKVGLKYVYIGNIPGHKGENTYCPECGKLLVKRVGFYVLQNNIKNGRCKYCGEKISGVWGD